jgi:hypothetical protein
VDRSARRAESGIISLSGSPRRKAARAAFWRSFVIFSIRRAFADAQSDFEVRLHNLVCNGKVDFQTAQREIATNWIKALRLGGSVRQTEHWKFR